MNETIKALKEERDQLRTEVRKLQEQIGQQLAACDCAAIMDTPEMHEKNKTVTRENPFWSNAFESVMRRTAECIALRAEVERLTRERRIEQMTAEHLAVRAERAEAELANAKELLREIRDHEVNEADEADKFLRDHIPSELSKVRAELAKERARLDWLESNPIHEWGFSADLKWLTFNGESVMSVRSAIDAAMKEDAP